MKRRNFLHNLSHLGAASLFTSDLAFGSNLYNSNSYLSNTLSSGKVLVLVKLNGGNDGLNTVVPLNQMSNLNNARPHVILPDNKIINLGEKDLGLHPELSGFKSLFDEKRLKIIQNVGYETPDFSHFRSMDIWESASDYNKFVTSGWMGRYIEDQHPEYPNSYPNNQYPDPLSIELGAPSLLLTAKNSFTSFVARNPEDFQEIIADFDNVYDTTSNRGTKLDYIQLVGKQSNLYGSKVKEAYESGVCNFEFSSSDLGFQFEKVTKLISGGLNTRIYLVELGGFDTHDTQVDQSDHTKGAHSILMKTLNDAVLTFMQNMDDIGRSDDLLVMTYSEFGRTIVSNGSLGTDHGTAAPLFVFGNKVDSTILGNNPVIPSNAEWQDNLATEFDFRQVYSSIINQWLTVNPTTEEDVLFKKFDQLPIIQGKYIDTDGDGVSDDRDLCNTTPLGAMVNTDGCEIFSLPSENYTIQTNGVSCSGKTNGVISISVSNTDHVYNLSIPETEGSYSLNTENQHQLVIDELEIGSYTLNFSIEGQENYLQTFEIGITEPPALSAKSSVNQKGKTMTVKLSGSDLYYAEVNGDRRSYKLDNFTLQLRPGMNTVKISTPQECQGVHVEQVFISEQIKHYPNPVQGELNLVIPGEDRETTVAIYSRSGSLIKSYQEQIPFSRIVTINTTGLRTDIYVVKVNGQTVEQTFKMIKR
tara:strand:- start:1799 stop:3895 length:2097 start_codon:yes stop_codon:yes gene_type:complete